MVKYSIILVYYYRVIIICPDMLVSLVLNLKNKQSNKWMNDKIKGYMERLICQNEPDKQTKLATSR